MLLLYKKNVDMSLLCVSCECKAKRQYLLTLKVSRYCLMALQSGVAIRGWIGQYWRAKPKAVSAHFTSWQILPFGFAERCRAQRVNRAVPLIRPEGMRRIMVCTITATNSQIRGLGDSPAQYAYSCPPLQRRSQWKGTRSLCRNTIECRCWKSNSNTMIRRNKRPGSNDANNNYILYCKKIIESTVHSIVLCKARKQ